MTELQASLIGIGSAIVVGVISYNKWQEYKAKKTVEKAFSSDHEDVLMKSPEPATYGESQRKEPVFSPPSRNDETVDAAPEIDETKYDAPAELSAAPASMPPVPDLPVDPLIDCLITLSLETPLWGEKILPAIQTLRHVGNKPVHYIGKSEAGQIDAVVHGVLYTELQAGIQLANRSSALNEIEYSEWVMRLRQIADELNAEIDVPDMVAVIASARELHQFVSEYDAQLSINVQSKGAPWAINTLLAALQRQGFDARPDGRLIMSDGEGGTLFSLSTNVTPAAETTSRLTLLLDVSCVEQQRDGFGAMLACAKSLAIRLNGVIVDDGNQAITDEAFAEISAQVTEFYGHMEEAAIPAGSKRALRLFS